VLIEPAIIIVVGGIVGFVYIAFFAACTRWRCEGDAVERTSRLRVAVVCASGAGCGCIVPFRPRRPGSRRCQATRRGSRRYSRRLANERGTPAKSPPKPPTETTPTEPRKSPTELSEKLKEAYKESGQGARGRAGSAEASRSGSAWPHQSRQQPGLGDHRDRWQETRHGADQQPSLREKRPTGALLH